MTSGEIERALEDFRRERKVGNRYFATEVIVGFGTAWAAMYFFVFLVDTIFSLYVRASYNDKEVKYANSLGKMFLFLVLTVAGAGIVYLIHRMQRQHTEKYSSGYKKLVVDQAAEGLFDTYSYKALEGFPKSEIKETGLIKMHGQYHSEDMVEGSCKNVTFRRADVSMKGVLTGNYRFRGSWSVFDFNKEFSSNLQIVTKNFKAADTAANSADAISYGSRHKIETENVKFNKAFTCYCQNDSEAFYLLTPQLMEALLNADLLLGYPMMVGLVGNKLHFVIHSDRNYLEPPTEGESLHLREELEKVRCELKAVRFVIDALSIDREKLPAQSDGKKKPSGQKNAAEKPTDRKKGKNGRKK